MTIIDGGVTAPGGFRAAGVVCGIKLSGRPDLALVVSDRPAIFAGLFTANKVAAPPVRISRGRLGADVRALVINSGNANACTGAQGLADAMEMTAVSARALDVDGDEVLVASTGVIGVPMPMDKVGEGIVDAAARLSADGGGAAAKAIMTTDAFEKQLAVEVETGEGTIRIGAMAKGAGMIAPQLVPHATMIAVVTTDAAIGRRDLQSSLDAAVERSFNRISVDGDTSTNDSVFLLANGASGVAVTGSGRAIWQEALDFVCLELAKMILRDGEGATKLITYTITGAASDADAAEIGRVLANSLLVKTAFFGGDANWGRIVAAIGRSGTGVDPDAIDVAIGGVPIVRAGQGVERGPELADVMNASEIEVAVALNRGTGESVFYGCDLTYDYVKINAEYFT